MLHSYVYKAYLPSFVLLDDKVCYRLPSLDGKAAPDCRSCDHAETGDAVFADWRVGRERVQRVCGDFRVPHSFRLAELELANFERDFRQRRALSSLPAAIRCGVYGGAAAGYRAMIRIDVGAN